jgi:two-component system, OmpR family, sensor histidine kinase ChvG
VTPLPDTSSPPRPSSAEASGFPAPKRKKKKLSTLTIIILAVNMIPLVLMGFGLLYIDQYNRKLIEMAYLSLERQGSMLSYILQKDPEALGADIEQATRDTLVLLIGENGRLVKQIGEEELLWSSLGKSSFLNDSQIRGFRETLASLFVYLNPLETTLPDFPGLDVTNYNIAYPETVEASRTGQTVFFAWKTGDSFILTTAIPLSSVTDDDTAQNQILFLLSDGHYIAEAIDLVRIDIIQAFITVSIITFLLSMYLSSFIAIPLKKLGRAAEEIRRGKRDLTDIPDMGKRHDEIGELSMILRQMTRALHNRMDSIERFAADVAHEIKNPLTSLRSAIETFEIVKKSADKTRLMQMVKEDIQRLDQLITDISQTSRLDSELARDMFQKVDLKALLSDLVDLWREPIDRLHNNGEASELMHIEMTPRSCVIMGKNDSLAQAFQNIISNALSFNDETKGPITIKIRREPQEDLIRITIEDHGPGMSEAVLEKIFQRFYTDRPEKKKNKKNSGLGLSIAKQIIEAHNGTIRAENIYDRQRNTLGARFIIQLHAIS